MATGKICDRCGKFYDKNHNKLGNNKRPVISVSMVDSKRTIVRCGDLCDTCLGEFMVWLNVLKGNGGESLT